MHSSVRSAADVLAGHPRPHGSLTESERVRARAFHRQADHDDFVAAHLLARDVVAELVGGDPSDVVLEQRCAECGGEHGKPYAAGLPEVSVSWSHSHGSVAAAASWTQVGIDVEVVGDRERDVTALVRRTATPVEAERILASDDPPRSYLRMWVAKEALVKVGVLALGGFRGADVSAGTFAGYALEVTDHEGLVVGLALGT